MSAPPQCVGCGGQGEVLESDGWWCGSCYRSKPTVDNDKYFKSATVFSCPPKCDAGGPPEDDGHLFNIPVEEECFSGARCKCGMTNMDFDMWRLP